jgi:outer membrane protein TolC
MKARTIALTTIGIVSFSGSVRADDLDEEAGDGPEAVSEHALKLDDLIEVMVRLNPDLTKVKVDRAIAKGDAGAARIDQQWKLNLSAQWSRDGIGDAVEVVPFTVVAEDKLVGSIGLGRALPTGGSISFEGSVQHSTQEYALPPPGSAEAMAGGPMTDADGKVDATQVTAKMTFKQPLLRGFGPGVALAKERKADLAFALATLKVQLEAENQIKELVKNYWEVSYAAFEVEIRHKSMDLAKTQEKLTHDVVRIGKEPPTTLNAVNYEMAMREEALLKSELTLETKSLELRRQAGLELNRRDVVLHPTEPFEISNDVWNMDEQLKHAKDTNRQLAAVGLQRRIADVDVDVTANARLPQVDVSFTGALIGGDKSAGNAFSSLGQADGFSVMAGLTVQFDIGSGAKSAHESAIARRHKTDVERMDIEHKIETSVQNAVHAVQSAQRRVQLDERAIQVAEDNVKAEYANFVAGKTSSHAVLGRQKDLIDAELRKGRSIADYHVAVAELQYLTGVILEQYRINIQPKRAN